MGKAFTFVTRSTDSLDFQRGMFDVFNDDKVTAVKEKWGYVVAAAHIALDLHIHLGHRQKFSSWLRTASKDQLKLLAPAPCFIPLATTACAASVNRAATWTSRVEDGKRR